MKHKQPTMHDSSQDLDLVTVVLNEILYRIDQTNISSERRKDMESKLEPIISNRILATALNEMNEDERIMFDEVSKMDKFDPTMLSLLFSRKEVSDKIEEELGKLVDELTNIPL